MSHFLSTGLDGLQGLATYVFPQTGLPSSPRPWETLTQAVGPLEWEEGNFPVPIARQGGRSGHSQSNPHLSQEVVAPALA